MNPSQIPESSFLGRLIRLPFKLLPNGAVVRVLRGPARGKRWIADSTTRGFWLGYWELENQRLFASHLHRGDVVYDVGAHVGLYTLLSSARVGESGHVYAFEPLQRNLVYLRRHIELNYLSNCTVVEVAVSDASGSRQFEPTVHDSAGHFSEAGQLVVRTLALDDFHWADKRRRPPNAMKINAEGAELDVLRGARKVIAEFSPWIFLSTHSEELTRQCSEWLQSAGYVVSILAADKLWAEKQRG
jgi:FkbM family methyltransferase